MTTFIYTATDRTPSSQPPVSNPTILYGEDAPERNMFQPDLVVEQVKETMVRNRELQGWTANLPTVTVTGTAISGGVAEAEIVAGGETLIFTLSHGTWASDAATTLATVDEYLDGGTSFDDEVGVGAAGVVRTSDVVLTATLPAAAGYSIAGDDTVTIVLDLSTLVRVNGVALTAQGNVSCSPASFVITNA